MTMQLTQSMEQSTAQSTMQPTMQSISKNTNTNTTMNIHCAYCDKLAISKCGKCQLVVYCTRECQVMHWNAHKTICRTPQDQKLLRDIMYSNYVGKIHELIAGSLIISAVYYPDHDIIVQIHEDIAGFIDNKFIHFAYLIVIERDNQCNTDTLSLGVKYIFNDHSANMNLNIGKYNPSVIKNKYPRPDKETIITFEF